MASFSLHTAHTADGNEDDVEVWCDKSDSNNLPVTEPPSPEEPIMPDEGKNNNHLIFTLFSLVTL